MKKVLIAGANSYIGGSFKAYLDQFPDKYKTDVLSMRSVVPTQDFFVSYDVVFCVVGIAHIKETNQTLVDELIPKLLGIGEIQKVLQNLLREGISIRDLLTIFETMADHAATTRDTDVLTEYARQSLKRAISSKYFPANEVTSVITLDPKLEQEIMGSVKQTEQGAYLTLDPEKTKAIMTSLETEIAKLENLGKNAIIITSPIVRMYFKKLTEDYFRDLIVVSYNEVESNVELQSVGMVSLS